MPIVFLFTQRPCRSVLENAMAQLVMIEALDARKGSRIVCDKMGIDVPNDISDFNNFGDHVSVDNLNDVRLHTYRTMNARMVSPNSRYCRPNWLPSRVMN